MKRYLLFFCIVFSIYSNLFSESFGKPYRISGQILEDYDDFFKGGEGGIREAGGGAVKIFFKNKSRKAVSSFTAVVFVSLGQDDSGYSGEYGDSDYYDDFYGGLYRFVLPVEERVGGNERGVFIYPLDLDLFPDFLADDYTELNYEIDFIYVSQIEYEDGEKWVYKGS